MKKVFYASLISVLFTLSGEAAAANFQIKGWSMGMPAVEACGAATITDNFGDIVRRYKGEVPELRDMGTTECEVPVASFGGSEVSSPAELLFVKNALVLVKLKLKALPLSNFVDIYKAFNADYGKAKRVTNRPFVTDTWTKSGESLVLERLGHEWDNNDVTVILKQDAGYRNFEAMHKANAAILRKLGTENVKQDIR